MFIQLKKNHPTTYREHFHFPLSTVSLMEDQVGSCTAYSAKYFLTESSTAAPIKIVRFGNDYC